MPANAKKIYDYLNKVGGQVGTFGTNPLWKIADGPFVLSSFSPERTRLRRLISRRGQNPKVAASPTLT